MKIKEIITLLTLSICVFLGCTYTFFIGTGIRSDIFIFYDYPNGGRLMSNIMKDMANMVTILCTTTLARCLTPYKNVKYMLTPFIIVCMIDIIDYLLFFRQWSIIKLPILMILLLLAIKKIEKNE